MIYYADYKGISKALFFNKIEVASSNFRGKALESEINAEKVAKFLTVFDDVNPEWILLGNGEMLRENSKIYPETIEKLRIVNEGLQSPVEMALFNMIQPLARILEDQQRQLEEMAEFNEVVKLYFQTENLELKTKEAIKKERKSR